jgi:hypothetical protein
MEEAAATGQTPQSSETVSDMFSFDLPEEETHVTKTSAAANDDPFNFDDEPAAPAAPPAAANDPFNFDEEPATPEAPPAADTDPFNFDEEPATTEPPSFYEAASDEEQKSPQAKAEEDAFASLLESAGQDGGDTAAMAPASGAATAPSGTADEFELENFSWDDTPPPTSQSITPSAPETATEGSGEFDLENFSWEETPPAPTGTELKPGEDATKK